MSFAYIVDIDASGSATVYEHPSRSDLDGTNIGYQADNFFQRINMKDLKLLHGMMQWDSSSA